MPAFGICRHDNLLRVYVRYMLDSFFGDWRRADFMPEISGLYDAILNGDEKLAAELVKEALNNAVNPPRADHKMDDSGNG